MKRWLPLAIVALLMSGFCGLLTSASHAQTQPRVVQIFPASDTPLPDLAVFALKLSKEHSNKPQAQCDVWGIRSSIPTEVIPSPRREAVLKAYGVTEFEAQSEPWVVLRCMTTFPDAAKVTLRWLNPERQNVRDFNTPADIGDEGWNGQRFNFTAASDWPFAVQCSRSNASAGCNPLEPVLLNFAGRKIALEDLSKIVLKDSKDKRVTSVLSKELEANTIDKAERRAVRSQLQFDKLTAEETYHIIIPKNTTTADGKPLLGKAAQAKPSLTVRMGSYPPLVKFTAGFGIAERAIGGIVPLTVRAIEAAPDKPVKLRQLKLTDEASIIEAMVTLRRLTNQDDAGAQGGGDYDEFEGDDESRTNSKNKAAPLKYPFAFPDRKKPFDTRAVPWLSKFKATATHDLPKQLEGAAFEVLGVPLKDSGLYLLEAESLFLGRGLLDKNRPMYVRSGALVTDLGVHLHVSDRTASVWVTQLSTGKSVADAQVGIWDCNAKKISSGASNANGQVQLDAKYERRWNCPLYAFAKHSAAGVDDISFVRSDWQRGIESWRFESLKNLGASTNATSSHTVLARNLLRGGETLHAKHFWRAINTHGELVAPRKADLPTTIHVRHLGSNESVAIALSWDARGNAQTIYKIPEGAKRGTYELSAVLGDARLNAQFRVEDFRLPVLKSEVISPTKTQFVTDSIDVLLRLSYLSGGVAAGEKVNVVQRLLKHTPSFADYNQYSFDNNEGYWRGDDEDSELDTDDDATDTEDKSRSLNANGTLTLSTKIKKAPLEPRSLLTEMEYRDPNGETYRAQGRTVVWPASVVLGSKVDYWASGSTRKIELIALTPNGKPAANAQITVMGGFKGNVYHRRKSVGGYYSYAFSERDDKPAPLCKGRSNAQGVFVCEFKPNLQMTDADSQGKRDTSDKGEIDSGQFAVEAVATDAEGRKSRIKTRVWMYAGGEVWFDQGDHDRMDVIAEKPAYKPGETATIQVRSPFREATAWVSVMRAGAVVDTLVVPLSGKNPVIQLPIKDSYAPNVFINVLAVRGRVAEPAATALVDLARPAFKLGLAELVVNSNQNELKVKVATDKQIYQSRETAIANITVATANGQALPPEREVTVFAIDEALLELLPNGTWNVLQTMLAKRGYGFESASANMQVMGKRHYGRKALPAGGGGGKSAARELFDTLLVWQGTVRLDAEGKASVRVPVNDSLTRFRVVAVANAGAALFGTGNSSFTATKDLQILPGLPLTAREGDHFAAGFTLRNTTNRAMNATANARLGEQNLTEQKISLAAGEAKTVSWLVQVPVDSKQLNWRIDAKSDTGRSDALVLKQTVQTPLSATRFGVGAQSLEVTSVVALNVVPPAGSVQGKGELRVSLAPAFATDAAGVRDYMRSYPFYCLEQRTSKAVALKDKALWQVIYNTLDQYVSDSGLVNYYPSQGGYDQGYDVLTSFVLSAAHEAKFTLPKDVQSQMLQGLQAFVQGKLTRNFDYWGSDDGYSLTERKLLALEALARYQKVPLALTESLKLNAKMDLPKLSNRAIVQWIDVLGRSDWAGKDEHKDERLSEAIKELKSRIAIGQGGHWNLRSDVRENRWYWMYSDEATTARLALLALDVPALKDDAEPLARMALKTQRINHWWQTQANVWGSLMLDKRAALAAGQISGSTQISFGDQKLEHDWQKLPQGETYTFLLGSHKLLGLQHMGTGKPYAVAAGTAWTDLKEATANNAQLSRSVKAIKQQVAGQYTAGDILEVRVQFGVRNGMGWVAVTDPIPTGATLLGSGLKGLAAVPTGTLRRGWRNSDGTYEAYPAYVERTATVIRAYYEYLWYGENTLTYQVRINNAGNFKLPPTQLEAMYDSGVYAYRPNSVMMVAPAK